MKKTKIINIEKFIPDAYHGTTLESARIIAKEGFKKSTGEQQYLGDGVYFFETSEAEAIYWAKRRSSGELIGVIKSTVNLGRCLDLNDREHRDLITNVANKLKEKEDLKITDAVVINFVASTFSQIDSVRATHFRPKKQKKLFKGSRFFETPRLIICMRNLKYILTKELAFSGE